MVEKKLERFITSDYILDIKAAEGRNKGAREMKLTDLQSQIMAATIAFCNYDDAETEKEDNAVMFNAKDLAAETGLDVKKVRSCMASLHKKGLMIEMEGGSTGRTSESGLTDEGIDIAFSLSANEPASEAAPSDFEAAFVAAGGRQPRGICKALRQVAREWKGTRKEFIAAAVASDLNPGNAAAEWHQGRNVGRDD